MKKTKKREFGNCSAWGAAQSPPMSAQNARAWARWIPGAKLAKGDGAGRPGWLFPMSFQIPKEWRKIGEKRHLKKYLK